MSLDLVEKLQSAVKNGDNLYNIRCKITAFHCGCQDLFRIYSQLYTAKIRLV